MSVPKKVSEEGDTCEKCGTGTLEYGEVENCSCYRLAPCNACMDNPLKCSECGEEPDVQD